MKVVVLGASGRAGSEIAREAARRGHAVLGIARSTATVPIEPGITAVAADAHDPAALAPLLKGYDAVISALHFDVTAEALLAIMRGAAVDRLLVTGGAASLEVAPGHRLIDSPDFPADWREQAMGGVRFLDDLRGTTDIDWTFFSPAADIFEGPRTGRFTLGKDALVVDAEGRSRISFADYAIAMVDELEGHKFARARFTAAY